MTARVSPYLPFHGTARQAMHFYQTVFSGELSINTYADIHASKDPSEDNLIAHAILTAPNGIVLMGSDITTPGAGASPATGSSVTLGGDQDEITGYWDKLADGATVTAPFAPSPWGALYGRCTDKFGTDWLVNVAANLH